MFSHSYGAVEVIFKVDSQHIKFVTMGITILSVWFRVLVGGGGGNVGFVLTKVQCIQQSSTTIPLLKALNQVKIKLLEEQ